MLLYCDAYVCIAYNDVPKVHWKTIYCGKFTVEETEHSAWAMFRQHDSWIISNIIFEAHPESWRNAVTYILQLFIRNWSDDVRKHLYWGVVIFGHFVPESDFGTHAMLFVMVILP